MTQKDRTRWLAMLPFLAVLCTPAQAGKHDPIYIPEPIYIPAGVDTAIIRVRYVRRFLTKNSLRAISLQAKSRERQYRHFTPGCCTLQSVPIRKHKGALNTF